MKTYSEKLKDPRWQQFRMRVFASKGFACATCGDQDKPANDRNHIHHKRYIYGKEPWEYDFDDVEVLCPECHEEIHECENKWRSMIRHMPSWMVQEFDTMAETFKGMDPEKMIQWASFCKNEARRLKGYKREGIR